MSNAVMIFYFVLAFCVSFCVSNAVSSYLQQRFPRYTKVIINHKDGTKTEYMVQKGQSREIDNLLKQERKKQGLI